MKEIDLLWKLESILPQTSFLTIYKLFIRQHLNYVDAVYDQPSNDAFSSKFEAVEYKAALAITGAIKDTAREELYQELGLEHIYMRPEVNSNRFEISLQGKISLQCQVASLSAFAWLQA